MSKRLNAPVTLLVAAFVFAMGFLVGVPALGAQDMDATPSADGDAETAIALHPAHIHSGSCDELGEVVYPLNDLQAASRLASPAASMGMEPVSTPEASPDVSLDDVSAQSGSEVDVSLDDILSGEHAINVHESPENIQNYIACGDITGSPSNGELTIELQELNDSGYVGEALLTDTGNGTTIVHVSIFPSDVIMTGTPAATPGS